MRHPLRAALLLLTAAAQGATGIWAAAAPHSWYDTFPGLGHAWIPAGGPYDEHLVTDVGAGLLALALLLAWAALADSLAVLRAAVWPWVVFAGLHLAFHARERGTLGDVDNAVNLVTLTAALVAPLGVLLAAELEARRAPSRPVVPGTAPEGR